MGFHGNIFTWDNGRLGEDLVLERLDRVCANMEWRDMFPHDKVSHLQVSYSDHFNINNRTNQSKKEKEVVKAL